MRARLAALGIVAFTAVVTGYLAFRAVDLIRTGETTGLLLGIGVLLLVVVGTALLVGEVRFGVDSQRLGRRLHAEGGLPELDPALPRLPSGRLPKETADELFEGHRAEVEAAPQDWRAWFRLATAYADARDTPRGRRAMRRAITLERAERG